MRRITSRISAIAVGSALAFGGAIAAAPAASASAASTAFSQCMDPYLAGQRAAYALKKSYSDNLALAVLYGGYSRCYYDLSQRTDISSDTEINAINNYNSYTSKAQIYIIKTGVQVYQEFLKKYGLRGMVV